MYFSLVLFIFTSSFASAQDYEYGSVNDLKGVTRYWVDTEGSVKARERIISKIKKALPMLELDEEMKASQIRLTFKFGEAPIALQLNGAGAAGIGMVWMDAKGKDKTRPRLIFDFQDVETTRLDRSPEVNFAREFIKAYKKANGLK